MIDIKNILKRSWKILWNYKVLWIFGILLALTAGGNAGSSNSGWRSQAPQSGAGGLTGLTPEKVISENAPEWVRQMVDWFVKDIQPVLLNPEQHIGTIVAIGVILLLVILVVSIIAAFVRYPAETAVMRMVDGYETDGTKLSFKQGWKLGWNRRAFRMWLIDLILSLPVVLLISIMIGAGLALFMPQFGTSSKPGTEAIVLAIGLGFLSLFLVIVAAVFLTVLRNFFARAAALEGLTLKESFKYGWEMFKRNWKSAGLMLLVMFGIGIAFGIAGLILFFLLIPAYIVLLIPAALASRLARPDRLRDREHLHQRSAGLGHSCLGSPARLLHSALCPIDAVQRLVQDLPVQRLDAHLPGDQGQREPGRSGGAGGRCRESRKIISGLSGYQKSDKDCPRIEGSLF